MSRYEVINEKFSELIKDLDSEQEIKLKHTFRKLKNSKIYFWHALLQLICSKYFILRNYDVDVESKLAANAVCDIKAVKNRKTTIVEIETGFSDPRYIRSVKDPTLYRKIRDASKIVRYSRYSDYFGLGTLTHYILQIPPLFLLPPSERDLSEVKKIKRLCDLEYKKPRISEESIYHAKIDYAYIIDTINSSVRRMSAKDYLIKYVLPEKRSIV
jgi:hypothetical protein